MSDTPDLSESDFQRSDLERLRAPISYARLVIQEATRVLRILGRSLRLLTIPTQSRVPKAFLVFDGKRRERAVADRKRGPARGAQFFGCIPK